MHPAHFTLLADLVADPANGWSIGTLGAIGEFARDADEPATVARTDDRIEVTTARGAIRIVATDLAARAWDSLSADGESWGHVLAFCTAHPGAAGQVVRAMGVDAAAIRPADRDARLFDLGIGAGGVAMLARTRDAALIAALEAAEGAPLFAAPSIMPAMLNAQPHRIMTSPAGRIEVYQPIPAPGGESPPGPHTHVLPASIAGRRAHSSNAPIPAGWQSALSMHPRSPWRTPAGTRRPFDAACDAAFAPLLARFEADEDRLVAAAITRALDDDALPWPDSRRGRHKARIVLRRLHAAGDTRTVRWRARYDRASGTE